MTARAAASAFELADVWRTSLMLAIDIVSCEVLDTLAHSQAANT